MQERPINSFGCGRQRHTRDGAEESRIGYVDCVELRGDTVLPTTLEDHRRSAESMLLDALRVHDPLALAEVYHRTIPAAHACARRLLASPAQIEALLRTIYLELWEDPPRDAPLEGWIRGRCFELAVSDLRSRRAAPASPSAAVLLPDLPAPEVRYLDAVERMLSELSERERTVLLLAHDRGINTAAQGGDAAEVLDRALLALAGSEPSSADAAPDGTADLCPDGLWMGDWVLGLVDPSMAQEFEAFVGSHPGCADRVRALRRGRRRLEGLPPSPDLGQRILVTVVTATQQHARRTPEPLGNGDRALWLPGDAQSQPADDPDDVMTGELAMEELLGRADEADQPAEPRPERAAGPDGRVTITEPITVVSVSMPDSGADTHERVRVHAPGHTTEMRLRRPNPYAELADLDTYEEDFELPDPHRVGLSSSAAGEPDARGFDSFYPDEELITRPSAGQRVLVVIGYVLPVLLGAGLGLYLADLLFTR